MARTRGGLLGNQDRGVERGRGKARGRGKGRDVQPDRVRLVDLANVPTRSRTSQRESSPSLALIGNERDDIPDVRADRLQGSSTSAISASIFKHVPRRARNIYYAVPLPVMPMNVPNQLVAPVVHIDATDLARTMATVMAK